MCVNVYYAAGPEHWAEHFMKSVIQNFKCDPLTVS